MSRFRASARPAAWSRASCQSSFRRRSSSAAIWSLRERCERANGRLFVEVESALPNELDAKQRGELVRAWVEELTSGKLPYTYAVHAGRPKVPGVPANPHVHVVLSERVNDGGAAGRGGMVPACEPEGPGVGGRGEGPSAEGPFVGGGDTGPLGAAGEHAPGAGGASGADHGERSHATRIETAEHLRRHPRAGTWGLRRRRSSGPERAGRAR